MLHTAPSILCVTDRTLCPEHFLSQISRIAAAGPAGVILREKDLCESAYRSLPRFSPSAGNIRSPASSTPSPPPPGPWGPRPFTFPCPFCAPCPRRNALPSPPWVPPAIPLRRPWRPRHWGPPIFWPDIFLTPAASRACPGGDWISWPRSAPLSPCLFTPLAASRRKLSPGYAGPGPGAPVFGAAL